MKFYKRRGKEDLIENKFFLKMRDETKLFSEFINSREQRQNEPCEDKPEACFLLLRLEQILTI